MVRLTVESGGNQVCNVCTDELSFVFPRKSLVQKFTAAFAVVFGAGLTVLHGDSMPGVI